METKTAEPIPGQSKEATTLHHRINEIIGMIPEGFPRRQSMIHALEDRQNSLLYTAPEAIGGRWHEVSRILGDYIPEDADWGSKIGEIFGRELED